VATEGTAAVLEKAGLIVERVFKVKEGRPKHRGPDQGRADSTAHQYPAGPGHVLRREVIRRAAVLAHIPTITTIAAAQAAVEGIAAMQRHQTTVFALQKLHAPEYA